MLALVVRSIAVWLVLQQFITLTLYDVGFYVTAGSQIVDRFLSFDLRGMAEVNIGVPPLGMLLTGIFVKLLGPLTGAVEASLAWLVLISSLTVIPVYFIARHYSEKAGILAALLYSLDPYLIQYTVTYLDAPATFFITLAVFFILKKLNDDGKRAVLAAGVLLGLASLTKLTYAIFTIILSTLLLLYYRKKEALLIPAVALLMLLATPWLWFPQSLEKAIQHNMAFNYYLPMVFMGPLMLNIPQSYPWYLLSYLGMGQVTWNTLPFITPLILLIILLWRYMKNNITIPKNAAIPAAAIILTIFLLPRNYWTYNWAAGTVQGILVKQFYPYYFYPYGPFLAILTAAVLYTRGNTETTRSRLVTYPIIAVAAISPLTVVMNLGLPYWDFIFTLIYSTSQGYWITEGTTAIILSTIILIIVLISAEGIYRRSTKL